MTRVSLAFVVAPLSAAGALGFERPVAQPSFDMDEGALPAEGCVEQACWVSTDATRNRRGLAFSQPSTPLR